MISRIFFDLDETLLHTQVNHDPEQECSVHKFDHPSNITYYTIMRPCAVSLIKFARLLIGKENVYVLTASTKEYARLMNKIGHLGFDHSHIISRETIDDHNWRGECHHLANPLNVLIDNLPFSLNTSKTSIMNVLESRYIHVNDYYGVNFASDQFEENIKAILTNLQ